MDMVMIDANIILRIILNDDKTASENIREFIKNNNVFIKNEVLAEVIYVLSKVYQKKKTDIYESISNVLAARNVSTESERVITLALKTFKNKSLDFVDCLLYAYNKKLGYKIYTLDKKLNKLIYGGN